MCMMLIPLFVRLDMNENGRLFQSDIFTGKNECLTLNDSQSKNIYKTLFTIYIDGLLHSTFCSSLYGVRLKKSYNSYMLDLERAYRKDIVYLECLHICITQLSGLAVNSLLH